MHRHHLLHSRIGQQMNQALGQVLGAARPVKFNRDFLAVRHLAKIREIRAHDGNPIGAGQMGHPATPGRRRIGHDGDRGTLEKIGKSILMHVAGEVNSRARCEPHLHRFHIAESLGMVSSTND